VNANKDESGTSISNFMAITLASLLPIGKHGSSWAWVLPCILPDRPEDRSLPASEISNQQSAISNQQSAISNQQSTINNRHSSFGNPSFSSA
jgi:hypothetical protein